MTILTKKEREQLRKERIEAEQELEKYRKWESIIHEHLLLADEYENASEYDKKDIMERIKELKEKEKEQLNEIEKLKNELEKEKNKGFFARLFGK